MKKNEFFPEINGHFAFGAMRLPTNGEATAIDIPQVSDMVDCFIDAGFNYFDTAHGYHGEKSEEALRECLTSRYPRDKYLLTDKLTDYCFKSEEDIRPFFEKQLELCGVEYFDFYLMHALGTTNYEKFQKCHAFEVASELKREGKIRHLGISFHDTASVLEQILNDHPEVEVVQIQFNYLDYDDSNVQSGAVYDVCRKYGKPVFVMEPVKGGLLANLPEPAAEAFNEYTGGEDSAASAASYAMRYAVNFDGIACVLSGMSSLEQIKDNVKTMLDPAPLDDREKEMVQRIADAIHTIKLIDCTNCRYCVAGCPMEILIPDIFNCKNTHEQTHNWNPIFYYQTVVTKHGGKASDCIECGMCEETCPQHLPIRELLKQIAEEFEKKEA